MANVVTTVSEESKLIEELGYDDHFHEHEHGD
ncbi:MAG: hypothetical protein RI973_179, partial [Bacteroidota bacterium]